MTRKVSGQKTLKAGTSAGRGATATAKSAKSAKPAKGVKPPPPPAKTAKAGKGAKEPKPKDAKPKDVKKEAKPAAPPKKKRSKSGVVRLKAYWGVFNQMMKRVHLFEYAEKRQADKKAAELSANAKSPHFVQLVKEVIRDAD
jgi:hypothetical protein